MAQHKVYYSVSNEASSHLSALLADESINEKFRSFLVAYINACSDVPDQRIGRPEFINYLKSLGLAASVGLVGKRIKELDNLGVLKETRCHIAGKASKILELTTLQPVFVHFASSDRKTLVPSHRPTKSQLSLEIDKLSKEGSYLSLTDAVPPRIESLFCILDAGMKLSGRDSRKSIECKYTFFEDDHINIQTSALDREHSDIAYLSDERAMRALNGILLDQLEDKYGSLEGLDVNKLGIKDEYFFFDIYELCWRMGLRPNDQNRKIAREMMARLRDTDFLIDASNSPYFMENYSMGAETAQYRYITEFFAKKEYAYDENGKRQVSSDRFYLVKFHTAILTNLITVGRSFISHDALASERSGLAHRLNNWAKAVIGVRPKNIARPFRYTLDEFRERVMPSARIDNFERDFLNLMKRQCTEPVEEGRAPHAEASVGWEEGGDNVAWLYGYYYQIEWDEEKITEHRRIRRRRSRTTKRYPLITIWRDVEDIFVGDNSDHNKALRRQSTAMIGEGA
tara:strand:+ start:13200 stop:14738 length:1539 start_codon:yes stop_codon:yes gene_type:complete